MARTPLYTLSKYGMTMLTLGLAAQTHPRPVAVNCLWPRTTIATAAVQNILGGSATMAVSRRPEIMADAAHVILSWDATETTGKCFIDDDVLRSAGVTDFSVYRYGKVEGSQLKIDLFLSGGRTSMTRPCRVRPGRSSVPKRCPGRRGQG